MFFQWRQSKAGAEKYHSGMLPHAGTDSRVWREVKQLGNELSKLDSIIASQVQADVAILMDWENWWALELDSKPSNDLKLIPLLYSYYKPLFERNITVDFAHPESNLSSYKLVIAPNLYLVNEATIKNLHKYVQNGGTLVLSFFSGIVDENEHIRLGGYPAPFQDLLGLVVEEYVPNSETQLNMIATGDHKQFSCSTWSEVIHLRTAQALATFEQDYYAGSPAITCNRFGDGTAFYVGTVPDQSGMEWLINEVCTTAGINPVRAHTSENIEIVQRTNKTDSWLFILNYSTMKTIVPLQQRGRDLLTGADVNDSVELEPMGIAILQVKLV